MSNPYLSIIVPSIRTQNWERFISSVQDSCTKFSYEVIFIGPFKNQEVLDNNKNVRYIHSFDTVTVCLQRATLLAKGELIHNNVDDGVFLPDSLDLALDYYKNNCNIGDILNCRYREGQGFSGKELPMYYWRMGTYPQQYGLLGINPNWQLSLQPIFSKIYFINMGGYDCRWEYSNYAHIDFCARCQNSNPSGKVIHSPIEVSSADHSQPDHGPIQAAQEGPDSIKFKELWKEPTNRQFIDINNWRDFSGRWERRFSKEYSSYEEMCLGEKYVI